MSSCMAYSSPPFAVPFTCRGVLSSSVRPSDWASRRAGSMVSTTTCRPCSAARSARAADVVVLPTPPAPQQTTIRVPPSDRTRSMSSAGDAVLIARLRARCASRWPSAVPTVAADALVRQAAGQLVQRAEVDRPGQQRQLVDRQLQLGDRLAVL